jgi:NADPH:quinone reductase-like Zn-dependent oxidoreductase
VSSATAPGRSVDSSPAVGRALRPLWAARADGSVKAPPVARGSLDAAARAHERLESRATIGALVLVA